MSYKVTWNSGKQAYVVTTEDECGNPHPIEGTESEDFYTANSYCCNIAKKSKGEEEHYLEGEIQINLTEPSQIEELTRVLGECQKYCQSVIGINLNTSNEKWIWGRDGVYSVFSK